MVLGPNINAPMMPEANAPALAALARAVALEDRAGVKERALVEALQQRYSIDPKAGRAALDVAYADAMKKAAVRYPADDTIRTLYVKCAMDTQSWDYWEPGEVTPKGRGGEIGRAKPRTGGRMRGHGSGRLLGRIWRSFESTNSRITVAPA